VVISPSRWLVPFLLIASVAPRLDSPGPAARAMVEATVGTPRFGDWMAESNRRDAWFGWAVGRGGDVNGDGWDDVLVGAYRWTVGEATRQGRVWAYYGSPSGPSTTPDWTVDGHGMWEYFGHSVSTAGDVNADGYDDVIVGAPHPPGFGAAYAYYGSAQGLSTTPDWSSSLEQNQAWFGRTVRSAGDVNADGYGDVIVGAPHSDHGESDEGSAWVFLGSPAGLDPSPAWSAESNQQGALFGRWVGGAGDTNGDGYDDVIIGAHFYDVDQRDEGRAFVYEGSATGPAAEPAWTADGNQANAWFARAVAGAGDVNADGYDDVIVGAPKFDNDQVNEGRAYAFYGSPSGLSATADWIGEADQAEAWYGRRLSTAGDVNADGYADVIIGAPNYDTQGLDGGKVFVYLGSPTGLGLSPGWTAQLDQDRAWFGRSVSTAGDVDADGTDDLIVGAPLFDHGQKDEGVALVFEGSALGLGTGVLTSLGLRWPSSKSRNPR
jgi:FG-GAP repeat protein